MGILQLGASEVKPLQMRLGTVVTHFNFNNGWIFFIGKISNCELLPRSGQVEVMNFIRNNYSGKAANTSVLFLTPCHTTPYYSYIRRHIKMRFADCSPPGNETALYLHTSDNMK